MATEKSKEEQLAIVLKNYDKVKEENTRLHKAYDELREKYGKLERACISRNTILSSVQNEVDKLRDALSLANEIMVRVDEKLMGHKSKETSSAGDVKKTHKQLQNEKFIQYVREITDAYLKTDTLNGISTLAAKYKVTSLSKVDFFKYKLHEKYLTDEYILAVYDKLKKK